ncbi:MAG TPA: alpha-ketoglutarate-dependent dioxygenase AlkB [Anaerovoracaceae bacterium]|nr:alpha-ketoglutarate-dependent dioxygenase AlkB [Anaerovoracaceae bacterium]
MNLEREIFPGAWHLPGALSLLQQKRLIRLFKNHQEDLYIPKVKSGSYMNLQMGSFGWHWNAIDYKYYKTRNDVDDRPVADMLPEIVDTAKPFSLAKFPYHNPDWDICLFNYYSPGSTLGMHRDNSESDTALSIGHPVVSFSVGASCIFRVGGLSRSSEYQDIRLSSGDVFIFGGESRLRFHGITKIFGYEDRVPFSKSLNCGRINFTLRKL